MKHELSARVGADGVLTLTVPLGPESANKTVRVVVEADNCSPEPMTDPEEWHRFIEATSGQWQGEFVREPEGDYEQRDTL